MITQNGYFIERRKKRSKNSKKMKLPNNFEEFFYLTGLFLGDGHKDMLVVGKKNSEKNLYQYVKTLG